MPIQFRGISRAEWRRRAGRVIALVWRRLLVRTRVVAVTGSLGKTTTKELLAAILSAEAPTLATAGNYNGTIGVAHTILKARPWHRYVVVEIGTESPGWVSRSTSIAKPDVAVVLNVGRTHTNRFPTLDHTAREKAALLGRLGRGDVAVLNADDPRVTGMDQGKRIRRGAFRVIRFGQSEAAAVRATEINARWPERLSLTLEYGGERQRVATRLVGRHWANSVVAAAAAALACGVPLTRIAAAISRVEPFPARLEPRTLPCGAVILRDEYNGSIQSFEAAFGALRDAEAARKILVLTTVSDSEEGWVPRLRRIVAEVDGGVDVLVLVGTGSDTRRALKAAARNSIATPIHHFETKRAAANFLRGFLRDGDLALLRGMGVDHMGRLYHAQVGEVTCWIDYCPKMILCEDCPELGWKPERPSLVTITPERGMDRSSAS
jgi:UDP-N-acetylmuramoyl-tripeptide--D-alanyl-D-alanine ligase